MESVRSAGKKPTVDNVRAALGDRGSRIMILRMMAEVIAAEAAMQEFGGMLPQPEAKLKLVSQPPSPIEEPMQTTQTALESLMDEFAPILGCSRGVFEQIERLETQKCELMAELKNCQAQLAEFRPVPLPKPSPKSTPKRAERAEAKATETGKDIRPTLGL